jgi:hypothetical protein
MAKYEHIASVIIFNLLNIFVLILSVKFFVINLNHEQKMSYVSVLFLA